MHALYGDNQFSKHCLTARRLVENGVRFVEILDGATGRNGMRMATAAALLAITAPTPPAPIRASRRSSPTSRRAECSMKR